MANVYLRETNKKFPKEAVALTNGDNWRMREFILNSYNESKWWDTVEDDMITLAKNYGRFLVLTENDYTEEPLLSIYNEDGSAEHYGYISEVDLKSVLTDEEYHWITVERFY